MRFISFITFFLGLSPSTFFAFSTEFGFRNWFESQIGTATRIIITSIPMFQKSKSKYLLLYNGAKVRNLLSN